MSNDGEHSNGAPPRTSPNARPPDAGSPRRAPRPSLPIVELNHTGSKAQRVLRFRRWARLFFVAMILAGSALWYWGEGGGDAAPASRQPAVKTIDPSLIEAIERAGADVRPMLGETRSMMLVVRSDPAGAMLVVEGIERGETPAGLDLRCQSDTIAVELKAAGHARWRREVPCAPGLELTFEPVLTSRR